MTKLKDKVQNALDEARMLILGAQVLLGFQFRSVFENGFESLPRHTQYLKMGGLSLLIAAVALLMAPGAYHQIVEKGEDTPAVHRFTTKIMDIALLPFAVGLGIDGFAATEKVMGMTSAIFAGPLVTMFALFFWYGLEAIRRSERRGSRSEGSRMKEQNEKPATEGTKLRDKIKHALTEARVVLPGAQALLGFQFATILMEGFDRLPDSSKYAHLASLAMVAVAIVFLMTPAAYHRIVENGEDSASFHRFAGRMLLSAMVPLALGITGDFFVVTRKVSGSVTFASASSALVLLFFYGLWFGLTALRRADRKPNGGAGEKREAEAA